MFGKELKPAEKQTEPKSSFSKAEREEEREEERWAEFIDSLVAHIAVIRKIYIQSDWTIILHLKLFHRPRCRLWRLSPLSFCRISAAVIEKNRDLRTGYLMARDTDADVEPSKTRT